MGVFFENLIILLVVLAVILTGLAFATFLANRVINLVRRSR